MPNKSNVDIAEVMKNLITRYRRNPERWNVVAIATQFEVGFCLQQRGMKPDINVTLPEGVDYMDTQEVWDVMEPQLKALDVEVVVVVAQRFIHIFKCWSIVHADGYQIKREKIGPIRFDKSEHNWQEWTRTHRGTVAYTIQQLLGGQSGQTAS